MRLSVPVVSNMLMSVTQSTTAATMTSPSDTCGNCRWCQMRVIPTMGLYYCRNTESDMLWAYVDYYTGTCPHHEPKKEAR